MVLGIPTVKRESQRYLEATLRSIFDNLNNDESQQILVIIMIAKTSLKYVQTIVDEIQNLFSSQINAGMLDIIAPPSGFYPDFKVTLKQTLVNNMDRV